MKARLFRPGWGFLSLILLLVGSFSAQSTERGPSKPYFTVVFPSFVHSSPGLHTPKTSFRPLRNPKTYKLPQPISSFSPDGRFFYLHARQNFGRLEIRKLQRAVGFMNNLMSLVFSAGDMFGSVSASNRGTRPQSLGTAVEVQDEDDSIVEGVGEDDTDIFDEDEQDLWDPSKLQIQDELIRKYRGRRKKVFFGSRYSCSVRVTNATLLPAYMQLPFEEYSLLDQAFISRVEKNVFRFMVPANELVGLSTVPVIDVAVTLSPATKVLEFKSISCRLVKRDRNGTFTSVEQPEILSNNSLTFSARVSWEKNNDLLSRGRNLAKGLRQSIFRQGPAVEEDVLVTETPSVVRLTCRSSVHVGVAIPPPFSLIPRIVIRQSASIILSTIVSNLMNRFLDLLIEDFRKWVANDEHRQEGSARALLNYRMEDYRERLMDASLLYDREGERQSKKKSRSKLSRLDDSVDEPEYII